MIQLTKGSTTLSTFAVCLKTVFISASTQRSQEEEFDNTESSHPHILAMNLLINIDFLIAGHVLFSSLCYELMAFLDLYM